MWRTVKLGDVVSYAKSNAQGTSLPYVGMENIASETMELIGEISIPESTSTTFEFDESHVLFGRLRPYLRKVLVPGFRGQCSTEIFCLKPSRELLREYLAYWLLEPTVSKKIDATSTGARMPRANMNKLLEFDVTLPPLAEQQRIVAKLDAAFVEIENCIAKTHKQSADILSFAYGSIDNCLTALQEKFKIVAIKDAVTIQPSKKLALRNLKDDDAVSFMGMDMLGVQKKYSEPNEDRILEDVFKAYQYFENNDVLFAKITPCFENGKLGIIRGLTNSVGFGSSEFVVFRPNRHITSDFVYYCLLAEKFRKDGAENMSGAVGHKRVTKEYFTNYLIPLPPIKVQLETVQRLDNLWRSSLEISQIKNKKVQQLFYLKSAILAYELQPSKSAAA